MRKLKLQMQISIDGFVCGPNDEMDWMTWDIDDKAIQHINELTDSSDTILLGRKMTEGFIGYWSSVVKNPESPEYTFARKMMDTPKVVFTKTITTSPWPNTAVANGALAAEINKLKQQDGKDIIAYGGAGFVSSLLKAQLIDDIHLFVNPAAIGKGKAIFADLEQTQAMTLVKATPCACGIVILNYKPKK